jgi:hypothetical protein
MIDTGNPHIKLLTENEQEEVRSLLDIITHYEGEIQQSDDMRKKHITDLKKVAEKKLREITQ